ncbi:MAG: response regulator [Chloroflexi bacterium]|nr:response regulator [Chloroflexota bacterium]
MVNRKPYVLIVDDEPVVCDLLNDELSERGYRCTTVLSGTDALSQLAAQEFDAVLLDIRLPGMSGMEVLREIWLNHPATATIMITAVNDVNTAVEAMKLGASDYIVKPFDLDRVTRSLRTALENRLAASKPSSRMDAIALGVEAKLDPLSNYSKLITERAIDVARQLGIAAKEIEQWAATKAKLDDERRR